jgi:glycosyl transferase family 2
LTIQGQAIHACSEPPLPVEIAFLSAHGVAPGLLRRAAHVAATAGVSADAAILKSGLVEERAFYRALACETGLPFLDGAVKVASHATVSEAILAGVAPLPPGLANLRIALAPSGRQIASLLVRTRPLQPGLAITTPSALMRAVLEARAAAIAWRAANGLPEATPDWSYKSGFTAGHLAAAAGLTGLAVSFGMLAPAAALGLAMMLASLLLLSLVAFRIAAFLEPARTAPERLAPRTPDRHLPIYTIIVPLYRERGVLKKLVAALSALDYPAAKLDVKLVIEADDRETARALAHMTLPGFIQVLVAPHGAPRTKPRALNVALPFARGAYTVVYDAEDVPDPGQLRLAAAAFARLTPDVACLQARLIIDNTDDSWLTRLFNNARV